MMTYEEAMQRLSEMKSRFDDGFSSHDRMYLDSLYFALFGKEITNKGCSNCYRDAFIEINVKLKKIQAMPKKSGFVLKAGAVITFFGEQQCYTNANMTDEVALRFLSMNPLNERLFEKLPDGWKAMLGNTEAKPTAEKESEKDEIIARLTAENESLKKEIETLKAPTASKKRKKKSDTDAVTEKTETSSEEADPTDETTEADEHHADVTTSVDSEVSVEDADEQASE